MTIFIGTACEHRQRYFASGIALLIGLVALVGEKGALGQTSPPATPPSGASATSTPAKVPETPADQQLLTSMPIYLNAPQQTLTSDSVSNGDLIIFSVAADVTNVQGDVFIKKDTPVLGRVVANRRAIAFFSIYAPLAGYLEISIESVKAVDGTTIFLTAGTDVGTNRHPVVDEVDSQINDFLRSKYFTPDEMKKQDAKTVDPRVTAPEDRPGISPDSPKSQHPNRFACVKGRFDRGDQATTVASAVGLYAAFDSSYINSRLKGTETANQGTALAFSTLFLSQSLTNTLKGTPATVRGGQPLRVYSQSDVAIKATKSPASDFSAAAGRFQILTAGKDGATTIMFDKQTGDTWQLSSTGDWVKISKDMPLK